MSKRIKMSPNQKLVIAMAQKEKEISIVMIKNKLQVSFLKACELMEYLYDKKIVGHEKARTVNLRKALNYDIK